MVFLHWLAIVVLVLCALGGWAFMILTIAGFISEWWKEDRGDKEESDESGLE